MKYLVSILLFFGFWASIALAEPSSVSNYDEIYFNLPASDISFENNIDPYEAEDNSKFQISPYPLLRTSAPLVFKNNNIQAGYYLVSPKQYEGKNYLLFKQQGRIKHIIPVYETSTIVPLTVYPNAAPPKPKKKVPDYPLWPFKKFFGIVMGANDPPPEIPQSLIKTYDLDSRYFEIDLYYNDKLYKTIYKKE